MLNRLGSREPLHANRKTETAYNPDLHRNRTPRGSGTCWLYSGHLTVWRLARTERTRLQELLRRESSTREDLQPQPRSDVQRGVVLWDYGGSGGRNTAIGQGHKLDFGVKYREFCVQKAVTVVSTQAYIR